MRHGSVSTRPAEIAGGRWRRLAAGGLSRVGRRGRQQDRRRPPLRRDAGGGRRRTRRDPRRRPEERRRQHRPRHHPLRPLDRDPVARPLSLRAEDAALVSPADPSAARAGKPQPRADRLRRFPGRCSPASRRTSLQPRRRWSASVPTSSSGSTSARSITTSTATARYSKTRASSRVDAADDRHAERCHAGAAHLRLRPGRCALAPRLLPCPDGLQRFHRRA